MSDSDNPRPKYPPGWIREIRQHELRISLKELSRRLGYAYSTVQRYETNEVKAPPSFFVDFETFRATMARARAEAGEPRLSRPTRPSTSSDAVSLVLPLEVVTLLHATLGDALVLRTRQPEAGPPEPESSVADEKPAERITLAVLVNEPTRMPPRFVAVLRRRARSRVPRLPEGPRALPTRLPASNTPESITERDWPRRARSWVSRHWSERVERRVLTVGSVVVLVLVGRFMIHENRKMLQEEIAKAVAEQNTGASQKPLQPLERQKQAPCNPQNGEFEVDKLCWGQADPALPCPSSSRKYQGRCLFPIPEKSGKPVPYTGGKR